MYLSEWILKQDKVDSPVGDLARDAKTDPEWPRQEGILRLRRYFKYLGRQGWGDISGAKKALEQAWQEFKNK